MSRKYTNTIDSFTIQPATHPEWVKITSSYKDLSDIPHKDIHLHRIDNISTVRVDHNILSIDSHSTAYDTPEEAQEVLEHMLGHMLRVK